MTKIIRREVRTPEQTLLLSNILDSKFLELYDCKVITVLYKSTSSSYEVWARVPEDFDEQALDFAISLDVI